MTTTKPERPAISEPVNIHRAALTWKSLHTRDGYRVGSVIPYEFPAYARIDHDPTRVHRRPSRQLPEQMVRILYILLRDATTTPERCWFCVWEADGAFRVRTLLHRMSRSRRAIVRKPRRVRGSRDGAMQNVGGNQLGLPRAYHLYTSNLSDIGPLRGLPWALTPDLWWPEDRAWCVASEMEFTWTYIAGSRSLIDSVCEHPQLRAREVGPEDPIVS
jgi:hypothetical protein